MNNLFETGVERYSVEDDRIDVLETENPDAGLKLSFIIRLQEKAEMNQRI